MQTKTAARPAPDTATRSSPPPGAAFVAFEQAGLIGTGTLGTAGADKAAVRRRVTGAA